jgi:hypothetical protein
MFSKQKSLSQYVLTFEKLPFTQSNQPFTQSNQPFTQSNLPFIQKHSNGIPKLVHLQPSIGGMLQVVMSGCMK